MRPSGRQVSVPEEGRNAKVDLAEVERLAGHELPSCGFSRPGQREVPEGIFQAMWLLLGTALPYWIRRAQTHEKATAVLAETLVAEVMKQNGVSIQDLLQEAVALATSQVVAGD